MKKWKPTREDIHWLSKFLERINEGGHWVIADSNSIIAVHQEKKKLEIKEGTWANNNKTRIIAEECLGWTIE